MTARPSKHEQHRTARGIAVPCAAWHGTFGGRCLNCGYTPGRIVEDVIRARAAGEPAKGIR